jgi:uncharacterized protein YjbI with pentapeptide repeats
MYSTAVIALAGVLLLVGTILPGVRLWWPQHRDPVSRSDLGVALMTGALIAFAVLAVQLLIQVRSQRDANARQDQADRAAVLLQLGLSGASLSGLDLQGQDLSNAYMKEKDLSGANLSQSTIAGASLQDSKLVGANLSSASFDHAQLERADLRYAVLGESSFVEANLSGANLDAATLTPGVDLTGADLRNASARADLRNAVLRKADLTGAQLDRANLQGVDLTDADLRFADLRGADLRGANLSKAQGLEVAKDVSLATFNRDTRWPTTFYWPPERATRPRCSKPICTLADSPAVVRKRPPELTEMRKELERAANDGECLPGWLVQDQPGGNIEAHAPRGGASFSVSTETLPGTPLRLWAASFTLSSPTRIRSITIDGSPNRLYAVRAEDRESAQPYKAVHVWFFRGVSEGFHVWGEAPPETFSLFERDFIKLFAALGIEGDLFPWLRGGESTCHP